jgi:hypothetical protein
MQLEQVSRGSQPVLPVSHCYWFNPSIAHHGKRPGHQLRMEPLTRPFRVRGEW